MTQVTKTGKKGFRDTAAGIVGNVLEWYDFAAFGFLAPYIAIAFFPSDNEFAGLIKTFAIDPVPSSLFNATTAFLQGPRGFQTEMGFGFG